MPGTAATFCLVILLCKGALGLLVLGDMGEQVLFLGCSETSAIGGDIEC